MSDQPITEYGKRLQASLADEIWCRRVLDAKERVVQVEAVLTACGGAESAVSRQAVRQFAPGVPWPTFLHWVRRYRQREGPPWERLLDRRLTPEPWRTPEAWVSTVRALGRLQPQPSLETIRSVLIAEHGEGAGLGDTKLREILVAAGLWQPKPTGGLQEKVTKLHGGGGLVLLLAAVVESGAVQRLAVAIQKHAASQVPGGGIERLEDGERNERGQFTTGYNEVRQARFAAAGVDPVYHSVAEVRPERDLSTLQVGKMRVETLVNRLLGVISYPLVTESRGLSGIDGPLGFWLGALSSYPYKAATLNKTLAELKLLGAAEPMWESSAVTWLELSRRWANTTWSQLVAYVDTTQDPYWTDRFAKSGKVARTGRVQPCLSRVCVSAGPGVPIFTEVVSGTASLREHMDALLARADDLLGPGELGRITVVDAECGNGVVLRAFAESPLRDVVTVVKGHLRQNRDLEEVGEWQDYRERDRLREAQLPVDEELRVRVVEMERTGSRNPVRTWFTTTAGPDTLTTQDVADVYLSRWPHQEDLFRRGRDGVGLERSHGYGVSTVQNVAVLTKREKAGEAVQKLNLELRGAISTRIDAHLAVATTTSDLAQRKTQGEKLDGRSTTALKRARDRRQEADKQVNEVERQRAKALTEQRKQETMPDEVYVRDTALDSITTCLKMTLLALLEFVCQEYLGKLRIMPRTFAERLVPLPVTIRQRQHEVIYEVEASPRDPEMTALLAKAFDIINKRQLRVGKRRLHARIREGPE